MFDLATSVTLQFGIGGSDGTINGDGSGNLVINAGGGVGNILFTTAETIDLTPNYAALNIYSVACQGNFGYFGQALVAQAVDGEDSNTFASVPNAIFNEYADQANSGTSPTTLYSDTIFTNQVGDQATVVYGGTLAGTANAKRIQLAVGGTDIYDSGSFTNTSASSWSLQVVLVRDTSTSSRSIVTATIGATSLTNGAQLTKLPGVYGGTGFVLTGTGVASNDVVASIARGFYTPV